MGSCAVLSFLGFADWGPVHVVLHGGGGPASLAYRLRPLRPLIETGPAAALLPAFLRRHAHLDPLGPLPGEWDLTRRPDPPGGGALLRHRYRIVHRCGAISPLRITAWRCLPGGRLQRLWGPIPLTVFLQSCRDPAALPLSRRA